MAGNLVLGIKDLGSVNGTFLQEGNGKERKLKVTGKLLIIILGEAVFF